MDKLPERIIVRIAGLAFRARLIAVSNGEPIYGELQADPGIVDRMINDAIMPAINQQTETTIGE